MGAWAVSVIFFAFVMLLVWKLSKWPERYLWVKILFSVLALPLIYFIVERKMGDG